MHIKRSSLTPRRYASVLLSSCVLPACALGVQAPSNMAYTWVAVIGIAGFVGFVAFMVGFSRGKSAPILSVFKRAE